LTETQKMDFWDSRYSEPGYTYGTEPNEFLVSAARYIPVGRVLCLAEGEGRNAVYLAGLGHAVTAVDSSSVGMKKAAELAKSRNVSITTVVADLAEFVIEPDHWDGIVSIFCHLPPELRARVHRASVAGLRPGGVFVLEAYTPLQLELRTGGPQSLELLMTLDMLKEELRGLELLEAREVERVVNEGHFHRGPGAVVQIVGVRPRS
jgi:SAM-dependent methyltransferase